jgi:hypothetical protein
MEGKSRFSITRKEEHFIYDSNKIEAFQDCPRSFFFRYVLGWKSEFTNIHSAFESAWREAISFLINRGMTDSYAQKACNIFDEIFYEKCPQDLHGKHPSKNAENARNGLREYAKGFRMLGDSEVLSTDVAGKVAISDDRVLYFKCDHISRNSEGQIWGLEHKTTSQGGSSWKNRWGLDFQTNAQSYAVSRLFEGEKVDVAGMKIDGAILRADRNNEFIRIPCRKSDDQLQLWRQECNYWIDLIEQNWQILGETDRSQNTMYAFPRNPTSCTRSGCRFEDMCEHWCNPLRHCENPPVGYEEDHYDPRDKSIGV